MTETSGKERLRSIGPEQGKTAEQIREGPLSSLQEAAFYGIDCVKIEQFEYGGYRYTNLKDAIAEAKRRSANPGASS